MISKTLEIPWCLAESRYTEALILFKSSQDFAWHAATLEGLASASIIEAYSAGDGLVRLLFIKD